MEFGVDVIQVQCQSITVAKNGSSRVEHVALELELPQPPLLVHQLVLSFHAAMLLPHVEVIRVEAVRPSGLATNTEVFGAWAAEPAAALLRPTKSGGGDPFQRLTPLVLIPQRCEEGAAVLMLHAYGICQGPLHLTLRCKEDSSEFLREALAALPSAQGRAGAAVERANASVFSFLLRHALKAVRVDALPLACAPITAAHLVPLLNAAQRLSVAGLAHHAEASEVELLAGLALMRSRKFVQCRELWQRCARHHLEAAGVSPPVPHGSAQSGPTRLEAQAALGCGLSISPFAQRISASCDPRVQKAIFLQVLIADCTIEHSGGLLNDRSLSAVLAALHLATQLHLVDLQAAAAPQLRPLDAPHDAQTVLASLQPHLAHMLCAVVGETLRAELATQWCQVATSALRCLDFVVQACISCAFEAHVIDTIVQCFGSCDAPMATDAELEAGAQSHSGRQELRAALHHLVETCHDVLPSVSTPTLQQAARRLAERLLGERGQRRWPPLHMHLLRLLMRIVVIAAGDVAPALVSGFGLHSTLGTAEGSLPFFDYLLRLLPDVEEDRPSGQGAGAALGGMPYVARRCWGILRTHLVAFMPRRDLQLFVRWLACSLSDSRSSYPVALSLLLALITELSRSGQSSPPEAGEDLRVHCAVATVSGNDLQPLIRPLHDWLLLLASKRGALRGGEEPAEVAPLGCDDVELFAGHWRCLSQGLLPSDDAEDHDGSLDNSSEEAEVEAWRRIPGHRFHAGKHWSREEWSSMSAPQFVSGPLPGDQTAKEVPAQDMASHARQLLLVWRTLVAVVDTLPGSCRPCLHTMARPVLEQVRQLCLQGSPPKLALHITVSVLQDLSMCDSASAPFIKSLLLVLCEWVPHSVLDETFAVLNQLLRLIGKVGLDDRVTFALTRGLLNQYTSRSKAQRESQQAFVDLLMQRRPPAEPSLQAPAATPAVAATAAMTQEQPLTSNCAPQVPLPLTKDGSVPGPQQEGEDDADAADEDISTFKDIVQLCFLSGRPCSSVVQQPVASSSEDDGPASTSDPEHAVASLAASGEEGAPTTAGSLDLVARMQFLSAVFHAMRYPHLLFIVEHLPQFIEALRAYITHALEKVRLLAVDLLQSICSTAFVRCSLQWRGAQSSFAGQDVGSRCQWWALLEEAVELAVMPLTFDEKSSAREVEDTTFSSLVAAGSGSFDAATGAACDAPLSCRIPPIGTPAVALACCRLLHVLQLCPLLAETSASGSASTTDFDTKRCTECLAAPLAHLTQAPWRMVRTAAASALLAWAPFLAWSAVPSAWRVLQASVTDGVRSGDCLGRAMALRLVPLLLMQLAGLPKDLRSDVLLLQKDWSADVRAAWEVFRSQLVESADGKLALRELGDLAAVSVPPEVALWRSTMPAAHKGETPGQGDILESVYVNELLITRRGGVTCRCTLDRFEDFLDVADCSAHMREDGGNASTECKLDPDPELSALLGEPSPPPAASVAERHVQDADVETGHVPQRGEELEDEEDLGIIDAGDEEWLEVFDVIRKHSAVTIFNHTDSTWYVSSKHPNLVRPLHGKRRLALRHNRQRSPSPPGVGFVSEPRSLAASPRPMPRRLEPPRGGHQWGSMPRGQHLGMDGGDAAFRGCEDRRRRPHSAPNRVSAGRPLTPVLAAGERRPSQPARASSHQWPVPRRSHVPRAVAVAPPPHWPGSAEATDSAADEAPARDLLAAFNDDEGGGWSPSVSEDAEEDTFVAEDGGSSSSSFSAARSELPAAPQMLELGARTAAVGSGEAATAGDAACVEMLLEAAGSGEEPSPHGSEEEEPLWPSDEAA